MFEEIIESYQRFYASADSALRIITMPAYVKIPPSKEEDFTTVNWSDSNAVVKFTDRYADKFISQLRIGY